MANNEHHASELKSERHKCSSCTDTHDSVYTVVSGTDDRHMCVKCVIQEAIEFAAVRGYYPGCIRGEFEVGDKVLYHYPLGKLVDHFEGGWAEI
jgi:hypothetical protein